MNGGRILFAMLKADFLERTRRTSFLVTLCLVVYLGYAVNTGQILLRLEDYRGIYNSAWVGGMMTVVITFFLGLTGFYLVKNAVDRDERTGVGQIIATTPISRAQYLLGKWLSNFTVLAALVGVLAVGAALMQLIQREDAQLHLWALVSPLVLVALPMMAFVAALAVLFESIGFLKGGFGNLVYMGVFLSLFMLGVFVPQYPVLDVTGFGLVSASMRAVLSALHPDYNGSFTLTMASDAAPVTFVWTGIHWTASMVLGRMAWVAASLGAVLAGALFFPRFDPSARKLREPRRKAADAAEMAAEAAAAGSAAPAATLTALPAGLRMRANLLRLVWLEALLLVKGLKWYWWAGMALLWIGGVTSGAASERQMWFMLAAIWPVLVWSKMGEREAHYQAEQLVYQAANPLVRLLAPAWTAGMLVSAAALSGALLGRLAHGEPLQAGAWALSVVFIPSLALALGTWSRTSKLFEVVYPILWYLGPFNRDNGIAVIDYLGIHPGAAVNVSPVWFAAAVAALMGLAVVGRKRQLMV